MVPGEVEEDVKRQLADLVERAARESGVRAEIIEFRPTTGGATEIPPDHPIVLACRDACIAHDVHTPLQGFQGGCDLVHFRSIGAAGAVLGPGSLEVAHKPDEFVPIDELVRASGIYLAVAKRMLSGVDPAAALPA
jgi:acetylornithine deacetylase/succinyl-diaminopimelate desuccinylase